MSATMPGQRFLPAGLPRPATGSWRVDPAQGIKPILGYMLALLIGLIIVAIFPWISIGFL